MKIEERAMKAAMYQDSNLCPLCGTGRLVEHTHERQNTIDGQRLTVYSLVHSICDYCGEYITTPWQSRRNKRTIAEAAHRSSSPRTTATGESN